PAARARPWRDPPTEAELLPDATARLELGSVAAAALADPRARALFADVTATVEPSDDEVADYHVRNPLRFAAARRPPHRRGARLPRRHPAPVRRGAPRPSRLAGSFVGRPAAGGGAAGDR